MLPVSLLFCLRFIFFLIDFMSVSVLSKVYCFFIVFVLCRVCPMLSVSLLFCLRFIVFFIVFVLCRVCPMLSVSLLFCLRFIVFSMLSVSRSCVVCAQCCLRPVSCVPSVPSVLSKVYCFFNCLRPVSCVPNVASVPSVLSFFLLTSSCVLCAQCCQ